MEEFWQATASPDLIHYYSERFTRYLDPACFETCPNNIVTAIGEKLQLPCRPGKVRQVPIEFNCCFLTQKEHYSNGFKYHTLRRASNYYNAASASPQRFHSRRSQIYFDLRVYVFKHRHIFIYTFIAKIQVHRLVIFQQKRTKKYIL